MTFLKYWSVAAALALLLAGCCGSVEPTVKIGLSAPFEGQDRDLGYEVLYAVRLATRERNEDGGLAGRYLIEMVALNDFDEAREAIEQAYEMHADPDVMAVLGGWSPEAAAAAAPVYERLGLAFVAPPAGWSAAGFPPTATVDGPFAKGYQALSGGVPPGPAATWAYAETQRMLDAIETAVRDDGRPARQEVSALLASD
ncbi:MAG: ABC transporter substrate-binding protein [Anaerolineae bacterium]